MLVISLQLRSSLITSITSIIVTSEDISMK